jgi:cytochrome c oxidase subunit IV
MQSVHDNQPEYEFMAHHSEEEGVIKRKQLWRVFWIMLFVTIVELIVGFYGHHFSKTFLMFFFISLTIVKAFYIVFSFMHLGHENKALKYSVLTLFCLFIIYLIWIVTVEGTYTIGLRSVMGL